MTYVAEGIRICTENTSNMAGGSIMNMRFTDILHPHEKKPQKTSEEVISHLKNKLGG